MLFSPTIMRLYQIIAFCTIIVNICGFAGQFSGFGGNMEPLDHAQLHKNTRVRACSSQSSIDSCYFCDCYGSSCSIPKDMRQINRYYRGLYTTTDEIKHMITNSSCSGRINRYRTLFSSERPLGNQFSPGCCDTIYSAIAPDTVTYNGEERVVVTPSTNNHLTKYQVIWVGSCRGVGRPCCNNGICENEEAFPTFVLVHTTTNNFQYEFIPIIYSRFCKCTRPNPP